MSRTAETKQIWKCPKCDFKLNAFVNYTAAWCPNRHRDGRGQVIQPLERIWDRKESNEKSTKSI